MSRLHKRHLFWGLLPIAWIVLALVTSMQPTNVYTDGKLVPMPWHTVFFNQLLHFFWWMLVTPLVVVLTRRFAFRPETLLRAILFHVPASAVVAVVFIVLRSSPLGVNIEYQWPPSVNQIQSMLPGALGVYWLIVAIVTAADGFRRYLEKQREAAVLEAQLSKAQLAVLRMQLEPHFLFNTLNTIASLIEAEPAKARRMITQVGDLLRDSLETEPRAIVPLEEELDWIERYLEIQLVRFSDRLTVEMNITPAALRAAVPALVLQPLVENAIKHGLEQEVHSVNIEIRAEVMGTALQLSVIDDGSGLPACGATERVGVGNTRRRLRALYGKQQKVELRRRSQGVEALLEFPFSLYEAGHD